MKKQKRNIRIIFWCGCLVLGWGLLGAVRTRDLYPFNLGIVLGFGAHMLIGGFAILTAICLKIIEERLDRIETLQMRSDKKQ